MRRDGGLEDWRTGGLEESWMTREEEKGLRTGGREERWMNKEEGKDWRTGGEGDE